MTVSINSSINKTGLVARYNPMDSTSYDYRENILTYSQDFTQASRWFQSNATLSSTSFVAPDNTATATIVLENTTNAAHYIEFTGGLTVTPGVQYTRSLYLKYYGRRYVFVNFFDGISYGTTVDVQYGTIYATDSNVVATITPVGAGWFRVTVTRTVTNSTVFGGLQALQDAATFNYVGDTTKGYLVWGQQFERGSVAGQYIPTTASAITRGTTVVNQVTPGTYNGTLTGSVPYEYTNQGTFVLNNNISNYISANTLVDSFWQGTWTVSAWVYPTSTAETAVIGHGTAGSTRTSLHCGFRGGYMYFGFFGDDVGGPTFMPANRWYNLTWMYSSSNGTRRMHINGALEHWSVTPTAVYSGTGNNAAFGRYQYGGASGFGGRMGDIQIYNTMLNDYQVSQNVALTRGRYGV